MRFAETGFAQFLASMSGRVLRALAGIALIAVGAAFRDTGWGLALVAVGLVPLAAGVFDVCLLSPLLGGPLSGAHIRKIGHAH
ncbi:MAG: DUF2892 domain-containing protein [Bauldia sp.]